MEKSEIVLPLIKAKQNKLCKRIILQGKY